MTDEQWHDIAEAWAKWIRGIGPRVQGRQEHRSSQSGWVDWNSTAAIERHRFYEWRIKPEVRVARMYLSGYTVCVSRKREDDPEPFLNEGDEWLGPWQQIPESQ